MDVEIKVDKTYTKTKLIIYTNQIDDEISNIIDAISSINNKIIKAYKDSQMYILKQNDIETIYSENGKVYARYNKEKYIIKNRLYELESILSPKVFLRISNSEIINFNTIKNIDFKVLGTLVINFKSGSKTYASRRYIPKIKNFLEM